MRSTLDGWRAAGSQVAQPCLSAPLGAETQTEPCATHERAPECAGRARRAREVCSNNAADRRERLLELARQARA
eukprot:CAMPEP_0185462804 /NCGR_PEP_ID=MMETSP1365-20130426/93397_1 /TAXON_ID=38817 /ORGANISM="Gephyrocapsa oceanica, Strain RCC1303" /LENGTH=73 /DNA_ID=CAMNT_0028069497 /DNA_START=61 /DNA_END=282 /DNA_ORIENTATION=-